jgi:hypothetical protein
MRFQPWQYRTEAGFVGDVTDITGYSIAAVDGDIGRVDQATYETGESYLVVDTGPWIFGRRVMLPAGVVERIDTAEKMVYVDRTKDQIKDAPEYYDPFIENAEYREELGRYYTGTYIPRMWPRPAQAPSACPDTIRGIGIPGSAKRPWDPASNPRRRCRPCSTGQEDGGEATDGTVDALDGIITALRAAGYEFVIPKSWPAPLDVMPWFIDHWPGYMITEFWARRIDPCEVLVSNGGVATGVVLGILMALAIGGVEASTADLDNTATDTTPSDSPTTDTTPSDTPTAVDGGIDSTELATRAALDDLLSTVLIGDEVVLARWPAAPPWVRHTVGLGQAGRTRIRLHDLRHSWATMALSAGIHPKIVQERLGHSGVAITLDTYSHVTESLHGDAANLVASAPVSTPLPNVGGGGDE